MKNLKPLAFIILIAFFFPSCATILGGQRTTYQTTKPKEGGQVRQSRVGYIIADVILTGALGLIVDFVTCAIYRPEPKPIVDAPKEAPAKPSPSN